MADLKSHDKMPYTYQGKQPRYKKTYSTSLGWLPFLSYSICKVDKITVINDCTQFETSLLGTNQARLSSIFINDLELLLITGLDCFKNYRVSLYIDTSTCIHPLYRLV